MDTNKPDLHEDNTFAKEALLCEIGAKLQQAREEKGFAQEQVIKELKFNASFLQALETGDWSQMPGEVYALGFLRQYAELLDINVNSDIDRIKTSSYELTTPLTYPDAPISPNRTWVVIAVLVFILVIILSNLFDVSQENESTVQATQNTVATSEVTPPVTIHINNEEAVEPLAPSLMEEDPIAEAIAHDLSLSAAQVYTFTAVSDDVWLQVFEEVEDQDLKLRREALLRAGQSFTLESETVLLLTSGKPTALEVLIDGELLFKQGSLGKENEVLKLFPLQ
jgi:cytoskeleton protein RodZ